MGIDSESDIAANLQIGPTTLGMVRIYIEADDGTELPMDFDPDEALEIAEELRAAAERARGAGDVGVRAHDDHRQLRMPQLHRLQQRQAVLAGHAHVGEQQVGRLLHVQRRTHRRSVFE